MIKLQLLLRPERRAPRDVAALRKLLASLELSETAAGTATVSAVTSEKKFEELFKVAPSRFARASKKKSDDFEDPVLPVPAALRDYVMSITVPARHHYL